MYAYRVFGGDGDGDEIELIMMVGMMKGILYKKQRSFNGRRRSGIGKKPR